MNFAVHTICAASSSWCEECLYSCSEERNNSWGFVTSVTLQNAFLRPIASLPAHRCLRSHAAAATSFSGEIEILHVSGHTGNNHGIREDIPLIGPSLPNVDNSRIRRDFALPSASIAQNVSAMCCCFFRRVCCFCRRNLVSVCLALFSYEQLFSLMRCARIMLFTLHRGQSESMGFLALDKHIVHNANREHKGTTRAIPQQYGIASKLYVKAMLPGINDIGPPEQLKKRALQHGICH